LSDGTEVLTEVIHSRSAEEPIAVVDLVYDEAWFQNDDVRNHWIVVRISVFGDIQILLNGSAHIGKKRPVSTNACTVLVRNSDVVCANGHETAISHFQFTMQLDEELCLPTILGTKTSAAEHENQGVLTLELGELAAFGSVVGKFVVGEEGAGHNIGSHNQRFLSLSRFR
jgi:hypothetical protein